MPLPWDTLSHLILDCNASGVSSPGVIALLRRCTRLVSINIPLDTSDAVADLVGPPLSVPSLESFILSRHFLPPRSLTRLIEQVSMPRLRRFHVMLAGCDEVQDSFCLVPLGKTSPLIDNLTIYLSSLTPQSLPETLQSFPSVTKLVVFDDGIWDWDDDLVQPCNGVQLINLLADTAVCPALQELVVHHCNSLEKSTLDSFIQRRIGMEFANRLRRLEISFTGSWSPEVEIMSSEDIRSYLSRGLTISLLYDPPSNLGNPFTPDTPWTGLPLENDIYSAFFRNIEGLDALG
ncbi:hypothetical protein MVEN_00841900 [Mycena venus]|uniref:F-box domain-containing protein n=1 Tax=Mycena venus TaxID=2733690 RepID=A0A8H6YDY5_9AGAR|nr:hypothetical protein MVEN_00841900 [Mycena venus]